MFASISVQKLQLHNEECQFVFFTTYYLGHQIKEDEMGGIHTTHVELTFVLETLNGEDHFRHISIGGRVILKQILNE
jgi:hypothetical protein